MILVASIWIPIQRESQRFSVKAQHGVLDARAWNPAKQGPIRLDGQWEFVWHRIVQPLDFASNNVGQLGYLQVPGSWTFQQVNGQKLDVTGYGTYRLTVLLPEVENRMGIRVSNIRNAHELYLNGDVFPGSGTVADNAKQAVMFSVPQSTYFSVNLNQLEIVIPVASFDSYTSGINQSIFLGLADDIKQITMGNLIYDVSLAAFFFAFGLYFLVFYFQRKKTRDMLYFSLYCMVSMVYTLVYQERIFAQLFPTSSYMLNLTILYITSVLSIWLLAKYLSHAVNQFMPKWVSRAIDVTCLLGIVMYPFITNPFPMIYFAYFTVFLINATLLVYIYRALRQRVAGSWYIAIFFLSSIVLLAANVLSVLGYADNHFFLPFAPVLLILSQAFYMSQTMTTSYDKLEITTDQLTAWDKLKDEFLAKTSTN